MFIFTTNFGMKYERVLPNVIFSFIMIFQIFSKFVRVSNYSLTSQIEKLSKRPNP